jgi:hypothetical protein
VPRRSPTAGISAQDHLLRKREVVAQETSEGRFRLVGGELDAPPGAERLTLRLHLQQGAAGVAYVDDLLVTPVLP